MKRYQGIIGNNNKNGHNHKQYNALILCKILQSSEAFIVNNQTLTMILLIHDNYDEIYCDMRIG